MARPQSPASYRDVTEILNQALGDPAGIRIRFANRQAMMKFRARLYQARAADREQSKSIYPLGHPNFGVSIYDTLVMLPEPDAPSLRVQKKDVEERFEIEGITSINDGSDLTIPSLDLTKTDKEE